MGYVVEDVAEIGRTEAIKVLPDGKFEAVVIEEEMMMRGDIRCETRYWILEMTGKIARYWYLNYDT
jgi:hypothetical protein